MRRAYRISMPLVLTALVGACGGAGPTDVVAPRDVPKAECSRF
jgi:hypothetical protein